MLIHRISSIFLLLSRCPLRRTQKKPPFRRFSVGFRHGFFARKPCGQVFLKRAFISKNTRQFGCLCQTALFFILFSWYHHITKIRQYVGVFGDKKGKTADKKRKFAGAERHKNGTKAVLCAAFFAFSRHLPPAAAAPRAFAAPKDPPSNKFTRLPQNDRFCVSADRISPSFCAENLPVFSRAGKTLF